MAEEEYKRSILANSHLQEDTNLLESGPVSCGDFGKKDEYHMNVRK
jgi:hypothetical protein